jgi:hypothetical protein
VAKPSTGSFRRSIDPIPAQPVKPVVPGRFPSDPFIQVPDAPAQPQTSPVSTQRVRRAVTGPHQVASDSQPLPTRQMTCQACGAVFTVVNKPMAYTVPCLACGALQRIEPG